MRKRILPALLAFALILSLTPVAFAAVPMALVQQTTGDPNKEFVYYIVADNAYVNRDQENVEKIEAVWKQHDCGFTVFSVQEDATTIWRNHTRVCGRRYLNDKVTLYKITLKNGEKTALNIISKKGYFPYIYIERKDGYSISYSTDGNNFVDYVDESNIMLAETTMARIRFDKIQDGTLTIRRSDGSAPADVPANTNPYKDVSTGDWFYPAVEYMSGKKYMTGYSDTEFGPNDALSRAMFVTILYRVSGEKVQAAKTKFTDVLQNVWYTEAVAWAVENGITTGTGDTTFNPNDPVTREQMATFLKRYLDRGGITLPERSVDGAPADLSESSLWAKDAVESAYKRGLLYATYNQLNPVDNATRTDAVVAFYNLLCAAEKGLLLPQTEACTHNWAARHVAEVGHYEESSGTHTVVIYYCGCGEVFFGDNPDDVARRYEHMNPLNPNACLERWIYEKREMPNEPQYVVDTPAHDETYCTVCGAVK